MQLKYALGRMRNTLIASVIAAGLAATSLAVPASAAADTCDTPGCGGVVRNGAMPMDLWIANCWSGTESTYVGHWPPCAKIFSQNKRNAVWFLTKGQSSTDVGKYYYDVDAYAARGGCITRFTDTGATFAYDRHGKDTLWVKISSASKNTVATAISC